MSPARKNIFIVLGLLTVAYAGYYVVAQQGAQSFEVSESSLDQMLLSTQVFIDYRQTLDQITFDFSLFEDERFRSLQSYSEPVQPKPEGRSNPFAPVGGSEVTTP